LAPAPPGSACTYRRLGSCAMVNAKHIAENEDCERNAAMSRASRRELDLRKKQSDQAKKRASKGSNMAKNFDGCRIDCSEPMLEASGEAGMGSTTDTEHRSRNKDSDGAENRSRSKSSTDGERRSRSKSSTRSARGVKPEPEKGGEELFEEDVGAGGAQERPQPQPHPQCRSRSKSAQRQQRQQEEAMLARQAKLHEKIAAEAEAEAAKSLAVIERRRAERSAREEALNEALSEAKQLEALQAEAAAALAAVSAAANDEVDLEGWEIL